MWRSEREHHQKFFFFCKLTLQADGRCWDETQRERERERERGGYSLQHLL